MAGTGAAATMTADLTAITLTFDDLSVLSTGGVDVFTLDMGEAPQPPPYYVTVDGRRFRFTGATYLERGHGAVLPAWVRSEEAAGRLTLFVRRGERLLAYVHDPAETEEDEGEAEE
ncbi:MAG: hypothetical protein EXR65_04925 [Dehalococcoidia bacterium]|nr:hypothetical protein [Dehalococcoidia bacterium]